jgi:hypothetical protein
MLNTSEKVHKRINNSLLTYNQKNYLLLLHVGKLLVMTVTNVTLTDPAVRCANQIRKLRITVLFSRVNSGPGKLGYHRQHGYR